jgi:biotin carboxyl carrier protein
MKYQVTIGDRKFEVDIREPQSNDINGNEHAITVNGRKVTVDHKRFKGGRLHSLLADNVKFEFDVESANGGYDIWHSSGSMFAEVVDEKTNRLRKLMGEIGAKAKLVQLKAPMPGLVLKVEVKPGQEVRKGDGLVIVEAMKMENELKAPKAGKVTEVTAVEGIAVENGSKLVVIE